MNKPTDDERQEIARRIREVFPHLKETRLLSTLTAADFLAGIVRAVYGEATSCDMEELLNRLADLIDPPARDVAVVKVEIDKDMMREVMREQIAKVAGIDCGVLLSVASELDECAADDLDVSPEVSHRLAWRIREACGEAAL